MSYRNEFIQKIAPMATKDMQQTGVLASVTIAQASLESAWGLSTLTKRANNLFGIKGNYKGESVAYDTLEFIRGDWVTVRAQFRVYPSWQESVNDHSQLFLNGTRDKPDRYRAVIGERDYKRACHAVYLGGYATDPDYPYKLIKIIEQYELHQYDTPPKSWQEKIMDRGMELGIITQPHDPHETAPKWFIIQTIINAMKGDSK